MMRNSIFDYVGNLDTLIAVIIGAVLATFGALVAELIQDRSNRKRRERDASRFFGDILVTIDQILDFTIKSQEIGDRWGPTTMRLFRTSLREADVYERNRERLFDLTDIQLRARIHSHFLRKTVPIVTIVETDVKIVQAEQVLKSAVKLTSKDIQEINDEISEHKESLERALAALRREKAKTSEICDQLEKLARLKFVSSPETGDVASRTQPDI